MHDKINNHFLIHVPLYPHPTLSLSALLPQLFQTCHYQKSFDLSTDFLYNFKTETCLDVCYNARKSHSLHILSSKAFGGSAKRRKSNVAFEIDGIKQISTQELLELFQRKEEHIILVDVREYHEYHQGHIPGVKLIPVSEFGERYEQELDKNQAYVFICHSGQRSQMVCRFLKENGYRRCANYIEGMSHWSGPLE